MSKPQHESDPRRWTRRHHYQQGPGFLFLATQGGRPSDDRGRSSLDYARRRRRAIQRAEEIGVEKACAECDYSKRSLYRWIAVFREHGIDGLVERSRRPYRVGTTVPAWVESVIITIRLLTYWNSKRIAAEMRRRSIYDLSHNFIDRLLEVRGCARGSVPRRPGPRYERERPNELWHVDIKGPFFISLEGKGYVKTYIVGLVDDYSRFIIGLRIHTDAQIAHILLWLDQCFGSAASPSNS